MASFVVLCVLSACVFPLCIYLFILFYSLLLWGGACNVGGIEWVNVIVSMCLLVVLDCVLCLCLFCVFLLCQSCACESVCLKTFVCL